MASASSLTRDTIVLRDSVWLRDSVVMRERIIHDTVYITREVYRDRIEAKDERQKAVKMDTVVVTEYRDRVIEKPPEKYVPKFYKWCTIVFWCTIVVIIMYIVFRFTKRRFSGYWQ
jgi:hypothetical protein